LDVTEVRFLGVARQATTRERATTMTETFTIVSTPREHMLVDVFTTACEGGINYWASVTGYRWSDGSGDVDRQINEFRAIIRDTEADDTEAEYVLNAEVIAKGIRLLWEYMHELKLNGEMPNAYQSAAINALHFGRYDDVDFDADTADMIVQFGLFGKVVYG
jgi:hypothetical protein